METVDDSALDALRESLGDPAVLDRIINLYLAELPPRMEAIRMAIEAKDADATRDAAHSLRGSSAALGATHMTALCERLELAARAGDFDPAPGLLAELEPAAGETEAVFRAQLGRP